MSDAVEPVGLLIVDDEPDILDALRRLFRDNYRVMTAATVTEAFDILDQNPVHIVICDQRMPRMTGVDFLTIVRERHPDIVRILITGYSDMSSVVDAINSGHVYGYVSKPWVAHDFLLLVARAAQHYALSREREKLLDELYEANESLETRNRELAKANRELQNLDRLKTVFMELVSHELNTPISIILGYTFLLQREIGEDRNSPGVAAAVRGIHGSGVRLQNIATKIFKVLASDKPLVVPHYRRTPLSEITDHVQDVVQPFLLKRNQTLDVEVAADCAADIDVPMMTDAVLNLVMNAIKFSQDGQTIVLRAGTDSSDGNWVRLSVADAGTGILPQDQPQIFQRFFGTFDSQHHSSGDYEFEKRGIGLGLALVRRFAELHHGSVEFESNEGEGSTFTIRIPRSQHQGQPITASQRAH